MRAFKRYVKLEDAIDRFLKELKGFRLGTESVSIYDAGGRILAEDLISPMDLPYVDKAAMDGYAVRAEDTFGASMNNPVRLKVVGALRAGESKGLEVKEGEAVEVATGAVMPKGANAVLMVEYTSKVGDEVEIYRPVTPLKNVARVGEDVRKGELVLKRGTRLKPYDIALIASLGMKEVKVYRKPRVGVISTGDELLEPGEPLEFGKVYNSNRPALISALRSIGCEPVDFGMVRDDAEELRERMGEALKSCDLLLITAGTSVGERDLVPDVIDSLGEPGMLVHGVRLRPGAPLGLAIVNGKPVISMPGYPVSNLVCFYLVVRRVVNSILGTYEEPEAKVKARMKRRVASMGLRTFLRVRLIESDGVLYAEPIRAFGAGIVSSLVKANGFVIIPEDKEGVEEGEEVEVVLLRPIGW